MVNQREPQIGNGDRCTTFAEPIAALDPFRSSLPEIVDQISRELDLGNPVSCWAKRGAWVLTHAASTVGQEVAPVQQGIREALNHDIPQTMVGTIIYLARQFEQMLSGTDGDGHAAGRLIEVSMVNCVAFPWKEVLERLAVEPSRARDLCQRLQQDIVNYRRTHPGLPTPYCWDEEMSM